MVSLFLVVVMTQGCSKDDGSDLNQDLAGEYV